MLSIVIAAIILFIAYAIFSAWKSNNPEKWGKFQRGLVESEAKYYADRYRKALKKVPESEWMLMTREEKADVLRRRERLSEEYSQFSMEVRKVLVDRYGITPEKAARYK